MVAIKRDGLLLEEVNDEFLIFNPDRNEATALNQSAALVFEKCDGSHTIESIRHALDAAGLGPASDDAVWLALTELADAGLVELTVKPEKHLGRRELLKRLGVGAAATAAALPVIETIAAPSAAAQGSGPTPGSGEGGGVTPAPTMVVTPAPTNAPTPVPTNAPTNAPTPVPTNAPTNAPTPVPTNPPTPAPTVVPPPTTTVPITPAPVVAPAPSTPAPATPAPATPAPVPAPTVT